MVIAIAMSSCARASAPAARLHTASGDTVIVSADDRARAALALKTSEAQLVEWLGARPARRQPVTIVVPSRWRRVPASMDVESAIAFELARAWLPPAGDDAAAIRDGAAWYLQSRSVETLFDYTHFLPGHSADRQLLFGGLWVEAFAWLPVDRWTAGVGRGRYDDDDRTRGAAAFATLERYLTWPVLQGALAAWAQSDVATRADITSLIGNAVAQDLGWFFAVAFDRTRRIDYAVTAMTSAADPQCAPSPCYRTRVSAANLGTTAFSGSSRAPSGPYKGGDAVEIVVGFADGSEAAARWDGREQAREFEFVSAAPARFAAVDPRRVIVIDDNHLNNRLDADRGGPVPMRWMARWLIWLQDAALTLAA